MDFPKATITNNLDIDVDIYDVYNSSGDPKAKLTYTKLGSIKAGATTEIATIHFASQLQAMYTGKNDNLNGKYYHQFPMAVMGISKLSKVTTYAIAASDRSGTEQAFNFLKYTTANPSSKTAKDFVASVAQKDQKTAVDAFFKGTASFKDCSLDKWAAMAGWLTQFTSGWQGPYYLYTQEQGEGGKSTVRLVSVIQIDSDEKSDAAVIKMANSDGTLSANAESTTLAMTGDGGMSEESVGTGNLSVALTPVWMNVIQAKDDGSLTYLIGSALAGTINGINVVGTQQSRTLPDSRNTGKTDKEKEQERLDSEREFDRTFSKITTLLGLLVGFATMVVMVKQMQGHTQQRNDVENKELEKNPDTSPEEVKKAQEKVDEDYDATIEDEVSLELNRRQDKLSEVSKLNDEVADTLKETRTEELVDRQVDALQDVLETQPPSDKIEQTAEDLYDIQQDIKDGKLDGVDERIQKVGENIQQDLQEGSEQLQEFEKDALTETQKDIEETTAENKAVEEAQQEQQEEQERETNEEVPDETFDPPETDPLPPEIGE